MIRISNSDMSEKCKDGGSHITCNMTRHLSTNFDSFTVNQ